MLTAEHGKRAGCASTVHLREGVADPGGRRGRSLGLPAKRGSGASSRASIRSNWPRPPTTSYSPRRCSSRDGRSVVDGRWQRGPTDRRLRAHRRHGDGGARRQERLDRLVVRAAIRLACASSQRCSAPMPTATGRSLPPARCAASSAATARARSSWRPTSRRTTAWSGWSIACRWATEHDDVVRIVEGLRGRVAMQMQLNPRFDYGKLIPATGRIDQGMFAVAGPDAVCLRTPVEIGADGGRHGIGGVHGRRRANASRFTSPGIPRTPRARAGRPVEHGGADGIVVAGVVGALHVRGPAPRGGAEITHHAEGAHVLADGRDRRRADDVAAGGDRRRAELGLPILLAARRLVHARPAGAVRVHGGGHRLAGLAPPGDRGRSEPVAAHVRHRRRA